MTIIQIPYLAEQNGMNTNLDRLVSSASNETSAGLVKGGAENASLGIERARLRNILHMLEGNASLVVPPSDRSIIS